jgi:hypothetical protein
MEIKPHNIANGIVHATHILAIGAIIDNTQKFITIIGQVNTSAHSVKTKASFIHQKSGTKKSAFLKKFCVYNIHKTAKKLS